MQREHVQREHGLRLTRAPLLIVIALAALLAFALMARPAGAQEPTEDGCDPDEQVACLPLPEETAAGGEAGAPSIAAPRVPAPPVPCPPVVFAEAEARIAAPAPPSNRCDQRAVIATVNYANLLYARALRSLDTRELPNAWTGEALAEVRGFVASLRASGRYATPELRSISLESLRIDGGRAHVRTLENWLYQERALLTGRVLLQENQWVLNEWDLVRRGGAWFVSRNDVTLVPAPLPPPPAPPSPPCILIFPPPPGCEPGQPAPSLELAVSANRDQYRLGETIVATVTNTGSETVFGGGGYACGLVRMEIDLLDRWVPAPGAAEICPAIAIGLSPGESRTETFTTRFVGRYRLVVQATGEGGGEAFAVSEPFLVGP
jgi:hypothetical protein